MTGRPTSYTPETGDLICSLLAEGQSLRKICQLEGMPHVSTVLQWLMKGDRDPTTYPDYAAFRDHYAQAREMQAELLADEIIDISDDDTKDELFNDEGKRVLNSEFVQRSRLRVDSRKWVAAKLLPKKYGDKLSAELTGKDGGPIQTASAVHVYLPDNGRRG